jgi:hypothetical protein
MTILHGYSVANPKHFQQPHQNKKKKSLLYKFHFFALRCLSFGGDVFASDFPALGFGAAAVGGCCEWSTVYTHRISHTPHKYHSHIEMVGKDSLQAALTQQQFSRGAS